MPSAQKTRKQVAVKPEEIAADAARDCLGDLINRSQYGAQRFVLTRHGKPAAAIVSVDDLKALQEADAA